MATDNIKTRVQSGPPGTRVFGVIWKTLNESGPRGFYRGYLPVLLRAIPVNSSAYFVIELTNSRLRARDT